MLRYGPTRTNSKENSADLVVELTAHASWVRLNGETFRIKPDICNHAGVTAGPVPAERSIMFGIYSPGGETRVDWGASGVSVNLFANGCEWSDWPPCMSDLTGAAGGPRIVGDPPKRFDVVMDYDMKHGIWTGAGHLYSDQSGQSEVEFYVQCDAANLKHRALMR